MLLAAGPDLETNSVNSNLILPDAIECQALEGHGRAVPSFQDSRGWWEVYMKQMGRKASLIDSSSVLAEDGQSARNAVYVSVWTLDQDYRTLDFVIACAGRKPIFVFTNRSSCDLSPDFLERRMHLLAERMQKVIPERRVFAIVGMERVTQSLAKAWESRTGHRVKQPAYYQATHTFCTRQTLAPIRPSRSARCRMSLATKAHISQVGRLCSAFTQSAHDDPYQLSLEQGIQEATCLIKREELYVCEVALPDTEKYEVVCIIATTRKSDKIAAVSKVYTHPDHRRQGYAKELLTYVCNEILKTKEMVVLFVAHDLTTAARVYGRVGFVGVGERPIRERALVEKWLELGFEDVDIGHW